MSYTLTTTGSFPAQPKAYVPTEGHSCPQCGAPIYYDAVDAAEFDLHGEYKNIPVPYYSCNCRYHLNSTPASILANPFVPSAPATWTLPPITCAGGGITQPANLNLVLYYWKDGNIVSEWSHRLT